MIEPEESGRFYFNVTVFSHWWTWLNLIDVIRCSDFTGKIQSWIQICWSSWNNLVLILPFETDHHNIRLLWQIIYSDLVNSSNLDLNLILFQSKPKHRRKHLYLTTNQNKIVKDRGYLSCACTIFFTIVQCEAQFTDHSRA